MNIDRSPLREQLAGEYVLGTLHGAARKRFEHALQESVSLREAVQYWEQALAPLALTETEKPQRDLLPAVEARLGWVTARDAIRSFSFWPALGFAVVAGFSILLWAPWQPGFSPDFALSVATSDDAIQRWQFAVDRKHNVIDVRVVSNPQIATDRDLELWLLVDGGAPRSLGLLSDAASGVIYRIKATSPLLEGNGLAVSVEPAGGSPSGAPTGPVIAAQMFPTA